jgi:zinc transporter
MPQLQPMPLFLNETAGADRGLICGYQLQSQGPAREVPADGIVQALAQADQVTWLHFNLSDQRARRWLLGASFVPAALREVLQEHDENRRVEWTDGGLLMVISDFTYEDESDPWEVTPIWCYAGPHLLLTGRVHALKSTDELRQRMRTGVSAASGIELLAQLLDVRTARIKALANTMTRQLDDVEDEILAGNIEHQREQLGRARRLCARLRREFAPERGDMGRLLHRSVQPLPEADRGVLESSVEGLGFAIEEIAELYERAKLLQEELASRLAENTGRNLYVLSLLTAVLLPMTLITGVYGMNVAHLPGAGSFPLVLLLILASGGITLAVLFWRRLL